MKKLLVITFVLCLIVWGQAMACTTMLVTKGASKDGSVMVAHSDDSELFDQRLVYVPAVDHEPGSLRPVYYDAASLGDKPEYHAYTLRRYVGTDRGPTYVNHDLPQSVPLGYIPQVDHTYAYFDGSYGIMNEHQLVFGECTDGAKIQLDPVPGKRIFYSAELSRVAAERCKTARDAVKLIGKLIETYGYYGTGETLPIGDTEEGWVMEMAPSPEGEGGLWVAKKVPEGEVFVAANEFRIREIDPEDPDIIELAELDGIKEMDKKALETYRHDPVKARDLLTEYCKTQANQVVESWWDFAWELVARYDDGFVNEPGEMAQEVGYPDEWYEISKWPAGPTTYEKPSNEKAGGEEKE